MLEIDSRTEHTQLACHLHSFFNLPVSGTVLSQYLGVTLSNKDKKRKKKATYIMINLHFTFNSTLAFTF